MEKRVISHEALIAAGNYAKERDYWLEKLSPAGELRKSYFPYDYKGKTENKFFDPASKGPVKTRFTGELFSRLIKVSNGFDYTLHMIAAALVAVLLDKYTYNGNKDIIIGAPIYKQKIDAAMEFVNTVLALRVQLQENMTFKELLLQVRQTMVDADKNKNYPIEALVSQLNMSISEYDCPLFDVAVLLENIHNIGYLRPVNLNMIFCFRRTEESVELEVQYNESRYERETVERIASHFTWLLQQALFNVYMKLSEVDITTEEEKKQLINDFNDTAMEYPQDKTVHELFEEQVEKRPGHIAAAAEGAGVTYRELNEKSDQVAHVLREKGVGPDIIVGIMIERSMEMVVGLLGILKAGGAYLPIDPKYPQERRRYMLADCNARILLSEVSKVSGETEVIDLPSLIVENDETEPIHLTHLTYPTHPTHLCYVIYTSGSTGRPKGVMIQHRSLVNLCCWHNRNFSVVSTDRAVKYAGFGFDASVWEIFPYLLVGASLHILPDEIKLDVEKLNYYFEKNKITIAFLPTQVCEQFMILENQSLRVLLTGGDKLNRYIPRNYRLVNNYGPTESSVVATSFEVKPGCLNIPIGKPTANVCVYVLDKNDHVQPIGVPGELCIGGDGLARGYLNQPELTAEKFDRDYHDKKNKSFLGGPGGRFFKKAPLAAGGKIYKTGDLACWLAEGNIEFLGRIDHQVKIRGYRIELSEVENQLRTHQTVKEAVVIARKGKGEDKYLCAYFVPRSGETVEIGALKQHLFARLPAYMVPRYMVQLEQIPLTPNGKIDRKTLPEPGNKGSGMEIHYVEPETDEEKVIAAIWREVLNLEKIGIHDNFFDLGGNSLDIIKVTHRLREIFKQDVPTAVIFLNPTLNLLSRYFNSKAAGEESLQNQEEVDRSDVIDEGRGRLRGRLQRMQVES
jgi:amino acid adenylation domain-containing protein